MRPDELDDLLSPLDHPVPHVDVEALVRSARRTGHGTRRAAAIVVAAFALGAGVAFALPGSPVRAWISRLREGGVDATVPADRAGIAVAPGRDLVVQFEGAPPGAYARVAITEGPMVEVRGPAGSTRFVSEPTRLVVEVGTPDTIDVALPRDARFVRLEVGDRTLLSMAGSTVTAAGPRDAEGRYVLPIDAGGS